jgi:hypothetical protein
MNGERPLTHTGRRSAPATLLSIPSWPRACIQQWPAGWWRCENLYGLMLAGVTGRSDET